MRFQLVQGHLRVNRHAVIQHVQVGFLKIHDTFFVGSLNVRIPNIPLFRDGPVKKTGAPVGTSLISSGILFPIMAQGSVESRCR